MAAFIQVKNLFCYPLDKILFFDNKVSKNLITKKKKSQFLSRFLSLVLSFFNLKNIIKPYHMSHTILGT